MPCSDSVQGDNSAIVGSAAKPVRVLLVEDDPVFVHLITTRLAKACGDSFKVVAIGTLADGMEILAEGETDVVLLDLGLPDSHGIETYGRILDMDTGVPVVVLTAMDEDVVMAGALSGGVQDYLVKGEFDTTMLVRAIRHAIGRQAMLTDAVKLARDARAYQQQILQIISSNADGMIIVDRSGRILLSNPAAQAILRRSALELEDQIFGFPLVVDETTEIDIVRRDEESTTAEMRVVETEWEGESVYLASLRDITERKRLENELEVSREQQLKLKDQFLSHVSHELRTPINAIHQYVSILLDGLGGNITPKQREYLSIVFRNVNQLNAMVGDLLEVTRAKTGKLTVEPLRISVAEILAESVQTLAPTASAKGISLNSESQDPLPEVYADPCRVGEVLVNLIDNAVKFTPEGGTVSVGAGLYEDDPDYVCINVKDTGCGIGVEDREKVFGYLHQVTGKMDSGRKGLGLGLYICKALVSRHGGQIWVESAPGQGSAFYFTLPLFSLTRLLSPILTEKNLGKGSIALISVRLSCRDGGQVSGVHDVAFIAARKVLERCSLPDLDVVLTGNVPGKKQGALHVVACADMAGADVLVRRIRDQLARSDSLNRAGIDTEVGWELLDLSVIAEDKTHNEVLRAVVAMIEEKIEADVPKMEVVT